MGRQPPDGCPGRRRRHPSPARGRGPAAIAAAREIAGDKDVIIASASVAQQALTLGLVDEVCVSLAPVLLGEGIPYFANLDRHYLLEDPEVIQGRRAVHLRYSVRR
jgi:dihydrofolate reductase